METPDRDLTQAYEDKLDDLIHDMKLGENFDLLTAEIMRMMDSKDKADKDAIEDMTLADLIERVCEKKAEQMLDDGDLDEDAMELAVERAERRSEGMER